MKSFVWTTFSQPSTNNIVHPHLEVMRHDANFPLYVEVDEIYNPTRRHQHLGGVSPDEFEAAAKHA